MSEWSEKPLGELATIRVSNVDKKSLASEYPVRLCNYMDVYSGTYLDDEVEYMEATASAREIANFSLQTGDVVITKDSESPDDIGIPAVIDRTAGGLVCGYHLAMLRPEKSKVDPLFLLKQIETDAVRRFYLKQAAGSTRYALSTGTIEATPIKLVPLDQQRVVARILRTIDTQIEATEKLIAKQERVRAGLMQDLFARGVDERGRLRPPREQAPHLYHQTELGWLPLGWEVDALQNLATTDITYGIVQAGPHVLGGIPYIRTGDMSGESLDRDSLLCTTSAIAANFQRSRVQSGEIVIAIRATIGKALVVPAELDGANLTQGTARFAPNSKLDRRFSLRMLRCRQVELQITVHTKGTTFNEITLADLRTVIAPFPTKLGEQRQISETLDAIDKRLEKLRMERSKLLLQKSGLMQDLLTGKVSVAPLLESAAT